MPRRVRCRQPEFYRYQMNLADITEVWRRGSVISSWLLDLTAAALRQDPQLAAYGGRVSDSGEGRWTIEAAIDEGVPAHVLSAALFDRFSSRGAGGFAEPGALGDAPCVRRPSREAARGRAMSAAEPTVHRVARGARGAPQRVPTRSSSSALPATSRPRRSSPRSTRWSSAAR